MTGSIKDYTTNFKFIIPEFNIATWHDYIEENFRSIDALFHNLFGINGFSGIWKTNSQYTAGQVLFVGEDGGSIYEGRLLKVVNDTNTGGYSTFSEAIEANPNDYELYADASSAQIFSELARDWANKTNGTIITPEGDDTGEYSAKKYAQDSQSSATESEYFKNLAQTSQEIAQSSATDAETSAQNALVSEQNSKTSETNAKTSEQNALVSEQNAKSSEDNAKVSETNAANSVETQTNNFNSYKNQLLSTTSAGVSEINSTKSSSIVELNDKLSNALSEINSKTNVLDKTMITNCLTFVPQDIMLELNDGTLTAKKGSKVWFPHGTTEAYQVGDIDAYGNTVVATSWDGAKFFYAVELKNDFVRTGIGVSMQTMLFFDVKANGIRSRYITSLVSGGTEPADYTTAPSWYDTTENRMKFYQPSDGLVSSYGSLPLCLATGDSSGVPVSIDQIFNGFGYIGSTIFALPGVRGLIPNGRKANGGLRSITTEVTSVQTITLIGTLNNIHVLIRPNGDLTLNGSYRYNEDDNVIYNGINIENACEIAVFDEKDDVFLNYRKKNTFHAVDRNDTSWLSGLGMPSGKYIDLTLLASGSQYTAPANGYFRANIAKDGYVMMYGSTLNGYNASISEGGCSLKVQKGEGMTMFYSGTVTSFSFVYAKGEIE